MHFTSFDGPLTGLEADVLAVGVYSGVPLASGPAAPLNDALGGLLAGLAAEEGFEGKDGQRFLIHTHGKLPARRVLLVGLGKAGDSNGRNLGSRSSRAARELGLARLAILAPDGTTVRSLVEGVLLGNYAFDKWKTQDVKPSKVDQVTLVNATGQAGDVTVASTIADGVMLARDLVNEPPITATPTHLAEQAQRIAGECGLECKIFDKAALEQKGMRLILAVSAGSTEEPRLIHLTYRPPGATDKTPSVAIVGKGLTFDAGGLCIKPTGGIEDMKMDMAGGAAILGAMKAIVAIAPKVVVHAIVPSSENLLGGSAYKPGDVIRSYGGKTVEVLNTDAEGRLILADALAYAVELKAAEIVDLATLTGAITVALGDDTAGVFGNDDALAAEIVASAAVAGEAVWRMPLDQKLKKQIRSDVADLKNVGKRSGGAITGALFLEEFVAGTKWVHMDIAGPAFSSRVEDHWSKGGTGFGVTTLLTYLDRAGARLGA